VSQREQRQQLPITSSYFMLLRLAVSTLPVMYVCNHILQLLLLHVQGLDSGGSWVVDTCVYLQI
jgi:hypothetical protein